MTCSRGLSLMRVLKMDDKQQGESNKNLRLAHAHATTRRHFLQQCQSGLGALALTSLLRGDAHAAPTVADHPLAVRPPHFAPKAKNVIYLHMSGSPPQHELFEY